MSARRIYVGRRFVLGEFRCSPDDELWRQENVIGPPGVSVATFPITSVVIRHEGQDAFLANPNHVVFYRRGERYRRALHDERGDACLFVDFDARTAAELGGVEGEIPIAYGPSDAKAYLRLRLAARAARAGAGDALAIEEAVSVALSSAFEAGLAVHRVRRVARSATAAEHARLVESAKQVLMERATERDSLSSIAAMLHVSEFHLARTFRAQTGFTLHAYRTHLRLRSALDRLARSDGLLTKLAVELGFNSHSHLAVAFRSVFGASPSEIRASYGRRGLAELPGTLAAPARS